MIWDQRYSEPGFAYGTAPNDFLAANARRYLPPNGDVLSLAEEEGRNAVFLAKLGFRVTGVDGSAVGLEKAQRLAAESGVEIATVVADLGDFDLGIARWDGVVSIWCHTPAQLRARLHQSVVSALRPKGVLLLEAYTPTQLDYKTGPGPSRLSLAPQEIARENVCRQQAKDRYRSAPSGESSKPVAIVTAEKPNASVGAGVQSVPTTRLDKRSPATFVAPRRPNAKPRPVPASPARRHGLK